MPGLTYSALWRGVREVARAQLGYNDFVNGNRRKLTKEESQKITTLATKLLTLEWVAKNWRKVQYFTGIGPVGRAALRVEMEKAGIQPDEFPGERYNNTIPIK